MIELNVSYTSLDSATLYGVMHAATYDSVTEWPEWTSLCALAATSLLLKREQLVIPPQPQEATYSRLSSTLFQALADSRVNTLVPNNRRDEAVKYTNELVLNAENEWHKKFRQLSNDKSYQPWLDRAVTHFWEELSVLHKGIFDKDFIPAIALLTESSENELYELHERSTEVKNVRVWQKKQSGDDYDLLTKAYGVTNLLRGAYYNKVLIDVNPAYKMHSVFHPLREYSLPPDSFNDFEFKNTSTETALICLLSNSLIIGKTPEERLQRWVTNINKVKHVIYNHELGLPDRQYEKNVNDHILLIANRAEIDLLSKGKRDLMQLIADLGLQGSGAIIGSKMNGPWGAAIGFGVGIISNVISGDIRNKFLDKHARREKHIEGLWRKVYEQNSTRLLFKIK